MFYNEHLAGEIVAENCQRILNMSEKQICWASYGRLHQTL